MDWYSLPADILRDHSLESLTFAFLFLLRQLNECYCSLSTSIITTLVAWPILLLKPKEALSLNQPESLTSSGLPAAVVSAGGTLQERGDQAVLSEDQRVGVASSLLLRDPRGNDGAGVLFSGSS